MSVQRKRYSAELKAKVALEAIKGQKNGQRDCGGVWSSPNADCPVEETSAGWFTGTVLTGCSAIMIVTSAALETCRCLYMSHLINSAQTSCQSAQLPTTYQQTSLISDLFPHNAADK